MVKQHESARKATTLSVTGITIARIGSHKMEGHPWRYASGERGWQG